MARFVLSSLLCASFLIASSLSSALPSAESNANEVPAAKLSEAEVASIEEMINPTFRLFLNESVPITFDYKTNPKTLSDFDPNKGVALIIHGWRDQYEPNGWMDKMKNFLLLKSDYQLNVVAVDWSRGSHDLYLLSSRNTRVVGRTIAGVLTNFYRTFDLDLRRIQLIGHSLGAQISGFTGKEMRRNGLNVGRITGLDPAGPNFQTMDTSERLAQGDAELVEVLHTNMAHTVVGGFGTPLVSGNVDFYLNGGARQTGCIGEVMIPFSMAVTEGVTEVTDDLIEFEKATNVETAGESYFASKAIDAVACSHSRAHQFFMVDFNREGHCQPVAYECNSFDDYKNGHCSDCGPDNRNCKLVGFFPEITNQNYTKNPSGYYMYTSGKTPYCYHTYHLKIALNANTKATKGDLTIMLQSEFTKELKNIPIEGTFEPGKLITTLFNSETPLGKIIRVFISYSPKSKFLGSYPADVIVDNIDIGYMSNLNQESRLIYSSELCDFETIAANSEVKYVPMC